MLVTNCQKRANVMQQRNLGYKIRETVTAAIDGDKKQMCTGKPPVVETALVTWSDDAAALYFETVNYISKQRNCPFHDFAFTLIWMNMIRIEGFHCSRNTQVS